MFAFDEIFEFELKNHQGTTNPSDLARTWHWVILWLEDKCSMEKTMERNMESDLMAGYNPAGLCINSQRAAINEFRTRYILDFSKMMDMSPRDANLWAWNDMVKRGVITR